MQAAPPCRIHTQDGRCFVVEDINAWTGQEEGIFATGYWAYEGPMDESVLIYSANIRYISFDYAALRQWQSEQIQVPAAIEVDLEEARGKDTNEDGMIAT